MTRPSLASSRRLLLATSALVAVAACTATGTGPVSNSQVQTVFNGIQFVLPLLDVLAAGVAIAVPAAAPAIALATPYLDNAGAVFQSLSETMTTVQAQPIVKQIEGYLSSGFAVAQKVVAANPSLAGFAPKLAQANAVLGLLTAFVNGVQAMPTAATVALPPYLHR